MKKILFFIRFSTICLLCLIFCVGCSQSIGSGDSVKDVYSKEDFLSIVIGKSTYQDIYEIASAQSMQITSYGGFCRYPTKDGYLQIKFYGKDLIVGEIEEIVLSDTE